jgi:hypothetical protein
MMARPEEEVVVPVLVPIDHIEEQLRVEEAVGEAACTVVGLKALVLRRMVSRHLLRMVTTARTIIRLPNKITVATAVHTNPLLLQCMVIRRQQMALSKHIEDMKVSIDSVLRFTPTTTLRGIVTRDGHL